MYDDERSIRWQLLFLRSRILDVLNELCNSPTGGHFAFFRNLDNDFIELMQDRTLRKDANPMLLLHLVKGRRYEIVGNCISTT